VIVSFDIEGGNFSKAGSASSEIKKLLKRLNVDANIIKRTVVACYEAEVNIVAHAWRGTLKAEVSESCIQLWFDDEGPGIEDIELAMQEGYSTASHEVREMGFGAGMGLPNIRKNVDSLSISSTLGKGTQLQMSINLKAA